MVRDSIIAIVLNRCGQRTGDTKLTNQLLAELLLIQEQLESGVKCGQQDQGVFFPWFLYKEDATLVLSANTEIVALPSDFLMEYEESHVGALWYFVSPDWFQLKRDDLDIIRSRYLETNTIPTAYAILGTNIYVRPLVSANVTLRLSYYAKAASTLATNVENVWAKYAADLLTAELVAVAGRVTKNDTLKAEGVLESKMARDRLYAMHVMREEAGRQRQRGDD